MTPTLALRASSGVGSSRNVRNSAVAPSSRSRVGVYAEAASPMARPATTGSTPLSSRASQSTTPITAYTTGPSTRSRRASRNSPKTTSATRMAVTSSGSL